MKNTFLKELTVLFFIAALFISNNAKAYDNTYVVIVAVADYKNFEPGNGDLQYTISDAKKITKFLMSTKGGAVPKKNIYLLTNKKAKKANILYYTKKMFLRAKANDRVIFYFSGHGDVGCFLPYDVSSFGSNLLYFSEVKQLFKYAKCTTKLLFADACHAGSLKNSKSIKFQKALKKESNTKAYKNYTVALFLSSRANETSLEDPQYKQGLFSYYLIKGLSGYADANNNKTITIKELFDYVSKKTADRARLYNNHQQHPMLIGKFNLNLVIAKL